MKKIEAAMVDDDKMIASEKLNLAHIQLIDRFQMKYRSLLNICFDNTRRLKKKVYYFEYRGVSFKLVQANPRKWADSLLTIVKNDVEEESAFSAAAEFLSALAWENSSRIALWLAGRMSWHEPRTIRDAQPNIFTFPKVGFMGMMIGYNIRRLPLIETENQRIALSLFREARSSNNDFLSFILFWQVLEIGGTQPVGFINKNFRRHRISLGISESDISNLPLNGQSLGDYLLNDCRHAIAHLKRKPGRTKLDIDRLVDRTRLTISVRLIEAFAEHYIREHLDLKKAVFLSQLKRGDIPIYIEEKNITYEKLVG